MASSGRKRKRPAQAEVSPFATLDAAADILTSTALSVPCSQRRELMEEQFRVGEHTVLSEKQLQLLRLREYEAWLQRQVREYEAGVPLEAGWHGTHEAAADAVAAMDEDETSAALVESRDDLFKLATRLGRHDLLLERLADYTALADVLAAASGGDGIKPMRGDDDDDDDDAVDATEEAAKRTEALLRVLMARRDEKTTQVLSQTAHLQRLEDELRDTAHKNRTLQGSNRQLKKALDTLKAETANQKDKGKDTAERKHMRNTINLFRHVFHGLILESGVNWAADHSLRSIILNLGAHPLEPSDV